MAALEHSTLQMRSMTAPPFQFCWLICRAGLWLKWLGHPGNHDRQQRTSFASKQLATGGHSSGVPAPRESRGVQ